MPEVNVVCRNIQIIFRNVEIMCEHVIEGGGDVIWLLGCQKKTSAESAILNATHPRGRAPVPEALRLRGVPRPAGAAGRGCERSVKIK